MIIKTIKKKLLLFIIFFHILGFMSIAYANGSLGVVLVDDVSGPYKVEVKSYANKLPQGPAHFSIYISDITKNENLDLKYTGGSSYKRRFVNPLRHVVGTC